jgi:lysophospholipase L1-like esterase
VPSHRIRRVLTLAASTCVAVAVMVPTTASASSPSVHYVALGDSYSAGVGAGGTIASSGACERSTNAYSALWAGRNAPASYVSVACSGATTADVINTQVAALNASTTLVSVTIGGNDVGFSSVMETCVLDSDSACQAAIAAAERKVATVLPGKLDAALGAIRAHAPHAKVVVLDYPEFYDLGHSWYCVGLSTGDRSALNQGADKLDAAIGAAAARAGDTFVDVRGRFHGHELCDFFHEWLHAVDLTDIGVSYHPNASGQSGGYLPALTSVAP